VSVKLALDNGGESFAWMELLKRGWHEEQPLAHPTCALDERLSAVGACVDWDQKREILKEKPRIASKKDVV